MKPTTSSKEAMPRGERMEETMPMTRKGLIVMVVATAMAGQGAIREQKEMIARLVRVVGGEEVTTRGRKGREIQGTMLSKRRAAVVVLAAVEVVAVTTQGAVTVREVPEAGRKAVVVITIVVIRAAARTAVVSWGAVVAGLSPVVASSEIQVRSRT
jgi:hypothetical protein